MVPLARRSTKRGTGNGRDASLISRLICFWRDMEKERTLHFASKSPPQGMQPPQAISQGATGGSPGLQIPKMGLLQMPKLPSMDLPKLPPMDLPKLPPMPNLAQVELPKLQLQIPNLPQLPGLPNLPGGFGRR